MPNLSNKLKSLGVKIGAKELTTPKPRGVSIEQVVPGRVDDTHGGSTYLVERVYPSDYRHGDGGMQVTASLEMIAEWAGERHIHECKPEAFAFLDIETTGLSGGTGTLAFLVGAGRFIGSEFHLTQFFLRDPSEEPAMLLALEEFLAPCHVLVTFNGKSFDVPILNSRYLLQGWQSPLKDLAQLDLLHLARRLWRDRLPSRTLGNLEVQILGVFRTQEDVPGWMIPDLYFDYIHTGDAQPLGSVFYHNEMDVVAMATLLPYMARMLENPLNNPLMHILDLVAIGRLYEDLGRIEAALETYQRSLENELPEEIWLDTARRLAVLHKRRSDFRSAVAIWEQSARRNQMDAYEELAKYYEHEARDLHEAIHWTLSAIEVLNGSSFSEAERMHWDVEFRHRLERLKRKNSS